MYNRLNVCNLEYCITMTFVIVGNAVLSRKQSLKSYYGLSI
jgi:hypothetical protein